MSLSLDALKQQREQLLDQMGAIDRLRRGTLSRHFLKKHRGSQTVTHGPYFVLQGYLRGKKFSQHVAADVAPKVAEHVENYKRFQDLAESVVSLTDQITQLEHQSPDSKKNSGRKRSPTNGTGKPKPS
jgi:hypothetical protein